MNKVSFVFLDESVQEDLDLATLTGLIVPLDKFFDIRSGYYKILKRILDQLYSDRKDKRIVYPPPILHASNFLRNSKENPYHDFNTLSDEFKISILQEVMELVRKHKLITVRTGYSNYSSILKVFNDEKAHNLNWSNLSRIIDRLNNNELIIPVMEGVDSDLVWRFVDISVILTPHFGHIDPPLQH